jgi:hypothetical protein
MMRLRITIAATIILLLTAGSSVRAGNLEVALENMVRPTGGGSKQVVKQDEDGNIHIAYIKDNRVAYAKLDKNGNLIFPIVEPLSFTAAIGIDGYDLEICPDDRVIVIHGVTHGYKQYAIIDKAGNLLQKGQFGGRQARPMTCLSPSCDLFSWGSLGEGEIGKDIRLPNLIDTKEIRIFEIGRKVLGWYRGSLLGMRKSMYMAEDRYLLICGDRRILDPSTGEWIGGETDQLTVYKFDVTEGRISDSVFLPLIDDSRIFESTIPFEGTQFKRDKAGNILMFTGYQVGQEDPELRIIKFTPDLEILQMTPVTEVRCSGSIDLPEGQDHHRLFWFTLVWPLGYRSAFHELALTADTLYYAKIFDLLKE